MRNGPAEASGAGKVEGPAWSTGWRLHREAVASQHHLPADSQREDGPVGFRSVAPGSMQRLSRVALGEEAWLGRRAFSTGDTTAAQLLHHAREGQRWG